MLAKQRLGVDAKRREKKKKCLGASPEAPQQMSQMSNIDQLQKLWQTEKHRYIYDPFERINIHELH